MGGHFTKTHEYLAIFRAMSGKPGETPRQLARRAAVQVYRADAICAWMFEADIVTRTVIGTRLDPRNDDRRLSVFAYTLLPGMDEAFVVKRIRDWASRHHPHNKEFDASALCAAWGRT